MKDMPENIEKVVVEEYPEIVKENKYLRAGNAKYTNYKVNLNTSYQDLSTIMDLSTTFDMLIKSKRVNIHSLCKAVMDSIVSQNSIVLVLSLRSLLERLAYFDYFARQATNNPICDGTSLEKLQETLLPKVVRGLYQTSSEIRNFDDSIDIRAIDIEPYEMKHSDAVDRRPLNILTPVKQLDKKISGVWNSYILLSEYVHPNFGDLVLSSTTQKVIKNEFGDPQVFRSISGKAKFSDSIVNQTVEIIDEAAGHYLKTINPMEEYSIHLKALSRSAVHDFLREYKTVLKNTAGFKKGTKCPCLSGKRITDCVG